METWRQASARAGEHEARTEQSSAAPGSATRVLVAAADGAERASLSEALELSGYRVDTVDDGDAVLRRVRSSRPHLIILDLTLPGAGGHQLLRALRAEGLDMPVLVLSRRNVEADRVLGFRLGADAYVTVPCGLLELLARVEALVRRHRALQRRPYERPVRVGALEIDPGTRTCRYHDRLVALRPRVFDLLLALARRRGAAVSRRELLREVWGPSVHVDTRTVDLHVAHLRRQLGDDPTSPRLVVTVRKLGYRLAVDE